MIMKITLIILLFYNLSACTVTKKRQEKNIDSVQVQKIDSGSLKKTVVENNSEFEWWKTTISYLQQQNQKPGDTTINNNYYTIPQPSTIVLEGGKGSNTNTVTIIDSSYKKAADSLYYRLQQIEKGKRTKFLSAFQVLGLCTAVCIVLFLIQKGLSSFKIVKK